jgi:hypothetical protein
MHFKRTAAAATMTALLAGGAATAGIAPANAATPRLASCYDRFTLEDVNGFRGYLDWNAEPSGPLRQEENDHAAQLDGTCFKRTSPGGGLTVGNTSTYAHLADA